MAAYLECVRMLPPSMVPSFDAKVRRKDGVQIPVTLHISALRDAAGELTGHGRRGRGSKRDPAPRAGAARVAGALPRSVRELQRNDCHAEPGRAVSLCQSGLEAVLWAGANGAARSAFVRRSVLRQASAAKWPRFSAARWMANWWTALRCATTRRTAACSSWS